MPRAGGATGSPRRKWRPHREALANSTGSGRSTPGKYRDNSAAEGLTRATGRGPAAPEPVPAPPGVSPFETRADGATGAASGRIQVRLAHALWLLGRNGEMLRAAQRAVDLIQDSGDVVWEARAFEGRKPPQDVAEQAGVNSRWLMLTTKVTMGDGVLTARSLIDANGGAAGAGQASPLIVRRDWGESD